MAVSERAAEELDRWKSLLDLEEAEARERDKLQREEKSPRQLEADGVLARNLTKLDETPALMGRMKWTLGEDPSRHGHLAGFDVRPGSVVALLTVDEPVRGVVVRADRMRITVVFDDPPETPEKIDLITVSDTVTLGRLRSGLDRARRSEKRQKQLIEILLGVNAPKAPPATDFDPIDVSLNEDQREAARLALAAEDVALIHGPFGTGKTTVLVEVARQAASRGERVLLLAASNAAVDHLALSILEREPDLDLVRVGHPARAHPLLEAHTLAAKLEDHAKRRVAKDVLAAAVEKLREANRRSSRGAGAGRERREARNEARALFSEARALERDAAKAVLERARVIAGTLTGYEGELSAEDRFDLALIDEASQAPTPAVLLGSLHTNRVVLAGDHRQLPPTVLSPEAAQRGLGATVFEALIERQPNVGHMLTVQHRMHEDLMRFSSERFYDGRLVAHPQVRCRVLADLGVASSALFSAENPLDVIDTAGAGLEEREDAESSSKENPGQAALTARFVRALIRNGLTPEKIGVITPYAAQVGALHEQLSEWTPLGVEIDTVDGFQGREKEAIVFDAVRSNAGGDLGFLVDYRRLNVALTRARRKLMIIADSATLSSDRVWAALFDAAARLGAHRSCFELPESDR